MKTGDNKSGSSSQVISLPKGGGAIKGIGEKFQPNLFSGTGNFSVPIFTSPGRSGFGPQLTLQYSTGNGNGPFGLGWQLSIPRITRKTEKGLPKYDGSDVFVMSGAEDLVPCLRKINDPTTGEEKWILEDPITLGDYKIARYRPRTEGLFARIEKWIKYEGNDIVDVYWQAITKENITSIYGKSASARLTHPDPEKTDPIYEWLLEETFDAKGNHILYEYVQEDLKTGGISGIHEQNRSYTQTYIRRILYGNTPGDLAGNPKRTFIDLKDPLNPKDRYYVFEVLFDYGDLDELPKIPFDPDKFPNKVRPSEWPVRKDPFSSYRAGFEIRTMRRCERVLMLHHFNEGKLEGAPLVKTTEFEYNVSSDFYAGEFVLSLTIEKLCEVINNDNYNVILQVTINTIDWLNELLAVPIFYDILVQKKPNSRFSEHIKKLVEKTKDYRNKSFSDLNKDERDNIKRLNRLLLEETYPQETPKNQYKDDSQPYLSLLESVKVIGYRQDNKKYLWRDMPPITFKYSEFKPHEQHYQSVKANGNDLPPHPLNTPGMTLIDLFGDGLPDILHTTNTGYYYWRNLGKGTIDRRHQQHVIPAGVALSQSGVAVGDMGGDGLADLIVEAPPLSGFYEATPDGGWKRFKKIETMPTISLSDPNVGLVDLTGDGLSDVLVTLDHHFLWFQCLGEEGYSDRQAVERIHNLDEFPDVYFNDPSGRVRLADMNGDGLNDIVLIHDGRIDYWPNLGYGQFGKRITMYNAPRIGYDFDPKRPFLVDLDGTGCTDIVYVNHNSVSFWFNHSGNGWSESQTIYGTPYVTDMTAIQFADFFGTGTACLVWSYDYNFQPGGNYKVLDFCGGVKPHLLIEMSNNMGATTCVRYASSTKFYLEDRENGEPWVTSLPFPVHVVEKVEVIDHISKTKLTTTYKYHHGYYDGREREFRGFGRVDQCDTEVFEAFAGTSLHKGAEFTNNKKAYHVPPVLTKTWFHTGIYFDENIPSSDGSFYDKQDMMDAYRKEFYKEDSKAFVLGEHGVETGDTPHEAYRALRGSAIRTEVYALDGTEKEKHPYTVTEQNFTVSLLQRRGDNRHAVFFTHPREVITYHYERNPEDPRVQHALTLEVDEYGNVLKSVAVGYGRRQALSSLNGEDRKKQEKTLITYTENDVTEAIDKPVTDPNYDPDNYRTPLPCETRTYELTGFKPENGAAHFSFDEWSWNGFASLASAVEIPYEQTADNTTKQKRLIECVRTLYRKDNLTALLPLDKVEPLALPGESYKLAFTHGLLDRVYIRGGQKLLPANPADVLEGSGADRGGYVDLDGDDYWWIPSGRVFYREQSGAASDELSEAKAHFFLPRRFEDPFGNKTFVRYDTYNLLLLETEDALGNKVSVGERNLTTGLISPRIDYRVLQPALTTDPNGNRSEVAFDTLGMVVGTAVMGKEGENKGDLLDNTFKVDLTDQEIADFFNDPKGEAATILGSATTRIVYDINRYYRSGDPNQPTFAATIAREKHVSDLDLDVNEVSPLQISFSYSDGFGREAQTKIQAEPGPVSEGGPNIDPRWVGTGTKVYNNKGKPVQHYEPFFSDTHGFGIEKHGVSPTIFYDPLERVICTMHPNHTYEKVVFDPWQQETWDVNDTVTQIDPSKDPDVGGFIKMLNKDEYLPTWYDLRTDTAKVLREWPDTDAQGQPIPYNSKRRAVEQDAAKKASAHADTPTTAHFDTLGRAFLTIAHHKVVCPGHALDGTEDKFATRVEMDIEGNQREVLDERRKGDNTLEQRIVMRYDYDMLGNRIHQASMEAGERWMLNDVSGKPIRAWDSRKFMRRMTYDALRRPISLFVTENGVERLAERTVYGESQSDAANHRTRVYQVLDGAGIVTSVTYDFKGNLLESRRDLLPNYKQAVDWNRNPAVNDGTFTSRTTFDALNRPLTITTPDDSVYRPTFNEANLLDKVSVNLRDEQVNGRPKWTPFVTNINYNAKGQRELIEYGNGVETRYSYERETFRLTNLKTTRVSDNAFLQDLSYTYDPVGNITYIRDDAQQTIYFNGQVVPPHCDYTYDAIYRLISATGREHIGQISQPETTWNDEFRVNQPLPGDGQAMRNYTEQYLYDAVGNFEKLIHQAANGHWTRGYAYNESSLIEPGKKNNRLSSTTIGGTTESYSYDAHGNMTSMPHLYVMEWDFKDQLQATQKQIVNNGSGEKTYYVYDSTGQRVRKVTEGQAAPGETAKQTKERIYLGGFEIYHEYENDGDTVKLERETLHIMDDKQRIAMVETEIPDTQSPTPNLQSLIRYQFSNHLGSAILELNNHGIEITYEEYYPYGSTSYQAINKDIKAAAKRYRYTGKEQDEESGLYYHGARYYAAWLGRWVSCDPEGVGEDGVNIYTFVRSNSVSRIDPTGYQSQPISENGSPNLFPKSLMEEPSQSEKLTTLLRTPVPHNADSPEKQLHDAVAKELAPEQDQISSNNPAVSDKAVERHKETNASVQISDDNNNRVPEFILNKMIIPKIINAMKTATETNVSLVAKVVHSFSQPVSDIIGKVFNTAIGLGQRVFRAFEEVDTKVHTFYVATFDKFLHYSFYIPDRLKEWGKERISVLLRQGELGINWFLGRLVYEIGRINFGQVLNNNRNMLISIIGEGKNIIGNLEGLLKFPEAKPSEKESSCRRATKVTGVSETRPDGSTRTVYTPGGWASCS